MMEAATIIILEVLDAMHDHNNDELLRLTPIIGALQLDMSYRQVMCKWLAAAFKVGQWQEAANIQHLIRICNFKE